MTQACSDVLRDTRGAQAAVVVENNREAIELLELVARASLNFSQLKNAIRGLTELYTNVGEILTGAHHEPVPVMQNDWQAPFREGLFPAS